MKRALNAKLHLGASSDTHKHTQAHQHTRLCPFFVCLPAVFNIFAGVVFGIFFASLSLNQPQEQPPEVEEGIGGGAQQWLRHM